MVGAEADEFGEGLVEVGFGARVLPFVGFELFGGVEVPEFESSVLV